MKKRLFSITIALALVLCCTGSALALSFDDAAGHWAADTLEKAYSDGILQGFEDGTIRPDEKITGAQMIAILCRVLGAETADSTAVLGLTGTEWYAEYAGRALHLGIISADVGDLNAPMTRLNAFLMLSRAFQLASAEPDYTAARAYSDFAALGSDDARVIASLVECGLIQGYNGSLQLSSGITRAEFVTVLYRTAGSFVKATKARSVSGSAVLSGSADLGSISFTGGIWLAANAESVILRNVSAPRMTIRSEMVGVSGFSGNSFDRLVIANNTGPLTYTVDAASDIAVIAVGDGSGEVSLGGALKSVETTGSGRSVRISSSADSLVIAGSGNTVVIAAGASVGSVRIIGANTALVVNGEVGSLTVSGSGAAVSGSGSAGAYALEAPEAEVSLSFGEFIDCRVPGIRGVSLSLSCPELLPAGEALKATVTFSNVRNELACTGTWYLDGKVIQTGTVTVSEGGSCSVSHRLTYTQDMSPESELRFVLDNVNERGEAERCTAEAVIAVENYEDEWFERYDVDRVLERVTSLYAGDYTLQWALDNDYDAMTKTIWANARGYSSTTQYLIWVNLTYQRVNIFEGSQGSWTLIHEYLCASGAGDCTPRGTFTVFGRYAPGWTTATYNCRPVVNFKTGSGYAFHSRLYDPTHSYLTDASIGFPVSHGCIRMYDEDVQWMYDNIPTGTTVVVY